MKKEEVRKEILSYAYGTDTTLTLPYDENHWIHISRPSKPQDLYVEVTASLFYLMSKAPLGLRNDIAKELLRVCR